MSPTHCPECRKPLTADEAAEPICPWCGRALAPTPPQPGRRGWPVVATAATLVAAATVWWFISRPLDKEEARFSPAPTASAVVAPESSAQLPPDDVKPATKRRRPELLPPPQPYQDEVPASARPVPELLHAPAPFP